MRFHTQLILGFLLILMCYNNSNGQVTWTNGNGTNNWEDPDNWDPAGIPDATDQVIFNGTNNDPCFIQTAAVCASITMAAGYTETISFFPNATITTGAGTSTFSSGTIDFTGSDLSTFGPVTLNGGTFNGADAVAIILQGTLTLTSGNFTCPSGQLQSDHGTAAIISGNGATFNHNNGSFVIFLRANHTIPTGYSFFDLYLQLTGTVSRSITLPASGSLNVNGSLFFNANSSTLATIQLLGNNAAINLSGDLNISDHASSANANHGTGLTINLIGNSVAQNIIGASTIGRGRMPSININQTGSSSVDISDFLNLAGNFTLTSNSTINTGSSAITFYGTRTLDAQSSSVTIGFNDLYIGRTGAIASVTLAGNLDVNGNLEVGNGSTLNTSASNYQVSLGGNLTTNGTFTTNNSTFIIKGTNTQNIDFFGSIAPNISRLRSIKTTGTATLTGAINIIDNLTSTGGGTLNLNSNATFISTSSKTAQIGTCNGITPITGTATVQRFIPSPGNSNRRWKFVASAVSGPTINSSWQNGNTAVHITGPGTGGTECANAGGTVTQHTNGMDAVAGSTPTMYTYNPGTQNWVAVTNTLATGLNTGVGYRLFVRGNRLQGCSILVNPPANPGSVTLRATGTLATGTQTLSWTANAAEWGLFGNPFQATIDWDNISRTNVNNALYIYNTVNGGAPVWGTYIGGVSTNGATRFISPGQAFHVSSAGAGLASITIEEVDKDTSSQGSALFKSGNNIEYCNLRLSSGLTQLDDIAIRFDNNATHNFDNDLDAAKFNFPTEGLTAFYNNGASKYYSIYSIPPPSALDTIFIHLKVAAGNASYSFDVDGISRIKSNINLYLVDKFSKNIYNMRTNSSIPFSTTNNPESAANDRFYILCENGALPTKIDDINYTKSINSGITIYPVPTDKSLNVNLSNVNGVATVQVFNITGILVGSFKCQGGDILSIPTGNLKQGIYYISIDNNHQNIFNSKFIKN